MSISLHGGAIALAAAAALSTAALAAGANGASSAGAPAPSSADPGAPLRTRVDAARTRLLAHYKDVDARSGLADLLSTRLDADESNLFIAGKPENASAADFWDWNGAIVSLDESLIDQLAGGSVHQMSAVRGLDEVLVPSHQGGPSIPCALYVPSTYSADKPAPLVVLLHGKGVSESTELAEPVFRGLAAATGAIVVAPYGRGDDLRTAGAVQDVYAVLDAVESTFAVDRRHVYLVGDSLGGYAAFDVATVRPTAWNALMAIRSTMDPADQGPVRDHLRGKAVYVVVGTADQIVSVDDVRRSVNWFRSIGLATSYYEVPDAVHDIIELAPAVQRAWREMLAGVRSLQAGPIDTPQMTPPPSQKP